MLGIPILVVNVNPELKQNPSRELGIDRLKPVVKYAKDKSVKIAFENINSPEYLYKTLDYFDGDNIGFCYDCRHENDIYNQMSLEQYFTQAYIRACKVAYKYSN